MEMKSIEHLDHTADLGLKVTAPTVEELFELCASAGGSRRFGLAVIGEAYATGLLELCWKGSARGRIFAI